MIVEDDVEFEEVTDGASEEKMAVFVEISLVKTVVPIFAFFLFPGRAGDGDKAMRVGEPISRF